MASIFKYEEDKVQQDIVKYLKIKGYLYTFTGGGTIKSMRMQQVANSLGYTKGVSDLIVFIPNGTVCIEVKRPEKKCFSFKTGKIIIEKQAGKQTQAQIEFERKIKAIQGHYYLVAYSLQEVIAFLSKHDLRPF